MSSHHRGSRSGGRSGEYKDRRGSTSPPPPPPRGGGQRGGSGSPQYSSYYKERFGSQSPEEYKSLRITNIDPKINGEDLRDLLDKVFRRYGEMHTKIVRQMDVYERIAYINFEHPDDARDAKHDCLQKIYNLLGKRAKVDPANVVRDQGGRFVQKLPGGPPGVGAPGPPGGPFRGRSRSPPPPPYMDQRGFRRNDSFDRYPKEFESRGDHRRGPPGDYRNQTPPPRPTWHYSGNDSDEDDHNASRTLFVGNLELDITTDELRRHFERYGIVEEIDIKTPHEAVTGYAFVRFSDLLSAREARKSCSGEYLRDNRCKIGWGKPIITRRLWVGGLGPDTSLAWLEKEYDRFGAIDKIDFVRGDNHAYILFSNTEAAVEAWKKMKGLKIKNGVVENLMQVDFSDSSMYDMTRNGAAAGGGGGAPPASGGRTASTNRGDESRDHYRRRSKSNEKGKRRRSRDDSSSPEQRDRTKSRKSDSSSKHHRDSDRIGDEPKSKSSRRNNPSSPAGSPPHRPLAESAKSSELNAQSLDDLYQLRSPIWTGVLVLKRSAYPIQLYTLAGDDDLVDTFLRNERGESVQLSVSQRLKLDQPRTSDILKLSSTSLENASYLLAVPNPNLQAAEDVKLADLQCRPLKLLVKYFKEKDAAGVINVTATSTPKSPINPGVGVVYSFPKCPYADDFMSNLCPKLAVWKQCFDDCLLMVLQKGSS